MLNAANGPENQSRWVLPPGLFRIALAVVVVIDHSLPVKIGLTAVFLFFMLSGYWVHVMWHNEYQKTHAPWRIFMTSRLWRLLPVYLLSLVLYIAVASYALVPVFDHSPLFFGRLHFYFSNLFIFGLAELPLGHRIVYPAWSLDIELQFYLIAPLLIYLAAARRSFVYLLALAMISVGFFGYYLVSDEGLRAFSGPGPLYLGFFLIGMGAARFNWRPGGRTSTMSLYAGAAIFILTIASHKTRALFLGGPFVTPIYHYLPASNFLLALVMAPYAMATVRVDVKTRNWFLAANDRHFSNLTYDIYLLHPSVITLFNFLMIGTARLKQMPFVPVAYAMIFLLSWLVYRYFDQPIDMKRRAYVKRAAGPLPAVTQLQPDLVR